MAHCLFRCADQHSRWGTCCHFQKQWKRIWRKTKNSWLKWIKSR